MPHNTMRIPEQAAWDQILRLREWLEDCPAKDGQPFYETAERDFEHLREALRLEVPKWDDEEIIDAWHAETEFAESSDDWTFVQILEVEVEKRELH